MSVHSAQRKEVRICVFVSSPMIQLVAVLQEVKSSTQRVTVVADTLSAARDIVTATRMMCIVTPRARLRTKYVIV
jgi:prephenate dehydrogenase